MTVASTGEAQPRADNIRVFREELVRLAQEGVLQLDAPQHAALTQHHDALLARLPATSSANSAEPSALFWGMRIVSLLGALALAASVFFIFYQFWGIFSTLGQVAVLAGAAVATCVLALWVGDRDPSRHWTQMAALLAFSCFVLNLLMLGQIFDLTPSSHVLLPWAAFAFLLAYRFRLRLLQAAGIVCLIGWIATGIGSLNGLPRDAFIERPETFFAAALVLFAVPQAIDHSRHPGFATFYRIAGAWTLFGPMLFLAGSGHLSYLEMPDWQVEGLYQALGFLGTAALIVWAVRRQWPAVANTGMLLFTVFCIVKAFDWWWEWMPRSVFFLLMGLLAMALLWAFKRLRSEAA